MHAYCRSQIAKVKSRTSGPSDLVRGPAWRARSTRGCIGIFDLRIVATNSSKFSQCPIQKYQPQSPDLVVATPTMRASKWLLCTELPDPALGQRNVVAE